MIVREKQNYLNF
ncbi:hypothetical protein RDI58_001481 [Solanum bulbocastanum]|uniref:Uncharacterized protein n=1 Tax=Solanum bulbocastanum TaxID=147425 RepID=A0AAN8UE34_SOLBU